MTDPINAESTEGVIGPSPFSLEEHYEPVRSLGEGEKSKVYLARNQEGNLVAIKEIPPPDTQKYPSEALPFLFDKDGVCRFAKEEIQAGEELSHPHIVHYEKSFTREVDGKQHIFIVLEYIDGKTLDQLKQGDLLKAQAKNCAIELIDALLYAARKGWLNRDLYSSNIMITKDSTLKLIDLESFSRFEKRDLFGVDEDGELDDPLRGYLKSLIHTVNTVLSVGSIDLFDSLVKILEEPSITSSLDQNVSIEHQNIIIKALESAFQVIKIA